eukprot:999774-Pyramimonas_sp.AAC.1
MLQKAAGKKVICLWKTGILPSAGHRVGVAGLSQHHLNQVRAEAGRLVGSRPCSSSLTLYPATQRSKEFGPIYMATCDPVCRCAAAARASRAPL